MKYYNLTWLERHKPDAFLRRIDGRYWDGRLSIVDIATETIAEKLSKHLDDALLSGFDEWNAKQIKADMKRIEQGTLNGLPVRIWVK